MPIIRSLLDTDFYKITMAQAVRHRWPRTRVRYRFRNRTSGVNLLPFRSKIEAEIAALGDLRLTEEEHAYLRAIPFLDQGFVDGLRRLRLDPERVHIGERNGDLDIGIEGDWYETIWFEVPVLAIVNEVYARHQSVDPAIGPERLRQKVEALRERCAHASPEACELRIMEFGTRRRFSRDWQETVVAEFAERVPDNLQGTSNVDLARRYGIRPQGTMAHEWLQAHQALAPLPDFQRAALDGWLQEFRGSLGIALSDVVGFDAFLRDFDLLLARAFEGARHDSGDPFVWAEKLLAHYRALGLDPRTKTAVFSDGLDLEKCFALWDRFGRDLRLVFGIGTNLTNDVGIRPLQTVIKLVEVDGFPVAKLSDSPGKGMCEVPEFETFLRRWILSEGPAPLRATEAEGT
ncbi:MAG: nicotinate phosphoribosyltransferase [Fimbriimonas sp.]